MKLPLCMAVACMLAAGSGCSQYLKPSRSESAASINDVRRREGLCEDIPVPRIVLAGASIADAIAVVEVTAVHDQIATMRIQQVWKSAPDVQLGASIDVPGEEDSTFEGFCPRNTVTVGRRYLALMSRLESSRLNWRATFLLGTPDEQKEVRQAIADPLPLSKWREGPDGIRTQLSLATWMGMPDEGVLYLNLIVLNAGDKPLEFSYRNPLQDEPSRCEVVMVSAPKRRVLARDIPLTSRRIDDPRTDERKYKWTVGPGLSGRFVLKDLTSPTGGGLYAQGLQAPGYFVDINAALGYKYYPAPPGKYSVSVECVNFLDNGAKLSAGPIEIRLKKSGAAHP